MKFNKKIAVFGDIMLDKYIYGHVDRISPEAPIPIVAVKRENHVPGGAANVAANVVSLGAKAVLFGITGEGKPAGILLDELRKRDIDTAGIIQKEQVHTIQKIRIIGQSQQLIRFDYESENYSDVKTNGFFIETLNRISDLSAIIISDYAKGTINQTLMEKIMELSAEKNIPVFVDPKPQNGDLYHHSFLITPNLKEASGLCNKALKTQREIDECGINLVQKYQSNIVITKGADGMSIYTLNDEIVHMPTKARQVYDVSGAGDTVIAALCLSVVAGYSIKEAVDIANHAAGIKVGKLGTAAVTYDELMEELSKTNPNE